MLRRVLYKTVIFGLLLVFGGLGACKTRTFNSNALQLQQQGSTTKGAPIAPFCPLPGTKVSPQLQKALAQQMAQVEGAIIQQEEAQKPSSKPKLTPFQIAEKYDFWFHTMGNRIHQLIDHFLMSNGMDLTTSNATQACFSLMLSGLQTLTGGQLPAEIPSLIAERSVQRGPQNTLIVQSTHTTPQGGRQLSNSVFNPSNGSLQIVAAAPQSQAGGTNPEVPGPRHASDLSRAYKKYKVAKPDLKIVLALQEAFKKATGYAIDEYLDGVMFAKNGGNYHTLLAFRTDTHRIRFFHVVFDEVPNLQITKIPSRAQIVQVALPGSKLPPNDNLKLIGVNQFKFNLETFHYLVAKGNMLVPEPVNPEISPLSQLMSGTVEVDLKIPLVTTVSSATLTQKPQGARAVNLAMDSEVGVMFSLTGHMIILR